MPRDLLPRVREALADRYDVEREIGHGGAARVFLARNRAGEEVALKVLHPELRAGIHAERFLREIRIASTLVHPRIAGILDSGQREWIVYFVMPFIQGATLRVALQSVRHLPVTDAIRVGDELLDALAAAHQHGVVHRDVKPDNLIVSPNGMVLVDFGIARAIEAAAADRVTASGVAVGTAAYMSPEQARADEAMDPRSDLYSSACLLFECLAGQPPFHNRNEAVLVQAHIKEPAPDVRQFRPDVPPFLADALARGLLKNPAERWQTAGLMRRAIRGER
ncbi:MAG TPA: serine/threonine-protein kinase [Gemmatimonadales bacterium]|jgi:serine/threonine-protein kinase|nr:serine/threonine-protein kinase [Gemmatimonadales bacterium]